MQQIGTLLILMVLSISINAQPAVKLKQDNHKTDFIILIDNYEMFISKKDILNGIEIIEKEYNEKHKILRKNLEAKEFYKIALDDTSHQNQEFINLFKNNLGVLFFTRKQIVLVKDGKKLKEIYTEEAPPKQSLDGVVTRTVYYLKDGIVELKENIEDVLFIGKANLKLAGYK